MIKTFEDFKSNIPVVEIATSRKMKWADEVLKEAKDMKSDVSPILADWLDKHPHLDFRKMRNNDRT